MTGAMPEKIDLSTVKLSDEKMAQLRQIFPEVFSEGKIDFDALKRSLGEAVYDDPRAERFGLRWPGKSRLQEIINQPSIGTLIPQPEESVDWDTTGNVIIEGDNLEVLKLLQKSYAGKIKMIYIDPPYNTGNDFIYPDNHTEGLQSYLEYTGQIDQNGRKLRSNTESEGRFHSNWLNMMYPRLYLARNLISPDGVIVMSIDDAELHNLKTLMNEIFGEENLIAILVWKSRVSEDLRTTTGISIDHEYLVIYSRLGEVRAKGVAKDFTKFSNPDCDPRGPWRSADLTGLATADQRPNLHYDLVDPATGNIYHCPPKGWRYELSSMTRRIDENRILFPSSANGRPRLKLFQNEINSDTKSLSSMVAGTSTSEGTRETNELIGTGLFSFPKPVALLNLAIDQFTVPSGSEVILDFFAGSGSTAHAVMRKNSEDGGNRKYILVQLPEPTGEPKTLDDGTVLTTVADICRERVRRAGKKIAAESDKPLDVGFRAYKLAPSNFVPWDGRAPELMTSARQMSFMPQTRQLSMEEQLAGAADHIDPDAQDDALLVELMLKLGFELTTPVVAEQIAGKTVYDIDGNLVLVCLDRQITLEVIEAMAARMPQQIICLDAGFPDDRTKVNAGQIIASHARDEAMAIAFKVV